MIDMKKSNQKGFSLIEILIAITVFAIGILAVGKMQITAIKGNSFANDLTKATTLAQDRMEKLIGLFYTDPLNNDNDGDGTNQDSDKDGDDDDGGNFGLDHADAATADNSAVDGSYSIFWNIATNHPIDNTKTIRVIVKWTDKGAPKKVSITSMKADII